MARARNIKPSFFTSEQLADNCPLGRLLFIGLWTLADYKGDLEWKERTIKIQILPWDDCDLKEIAINLDKSGLIRFYSDGQKVYINIPGFERHQNPHPNEKKKGSDCPAYSDRLRQLIDFTTLTINHDKSRQETEQQHTDPADSLLLNPSYCLPESSCSADAEGIDERCDPPQTEKPKRKAFKPPSVAEVSEYCASRSNGVDPERFVDFYQAKGWMVGKSKMLDWKASVRTWESKNKINGSAGEHFI